MNTIKRNLLLILLIFVVNNLFSQQRIGLVLSGGGATGLAHIGVIKALEERGIPIDYITGTSAGALVGAMYASGYSPEEMEAYVLSENFQLMSTGKLKPNQHFIYKEDDPDQSLIDIAFSKDSILQKSLPTSIVNSTFMDFEMLKLFGTTSATCGNNFDSLFIPFRCVASDIASKKSVTFSHGYLNQVVRASMTFPFYISPILIDNVLLFDGGLYNNFPANIMYQDFNPDFIIGSNVSSNATPPTEDNLISQVTNMLVYYSDFNLPCDNGIIIQPETTVTTFDFKDAQRAIQDGYISTLKYLDSVETFIIRRITKEELTEKRKQFRQKIVPLNVSSISTNSKKRRTFSFATKSMIKQDKQEVLFGKKLEKRYYRLYATTQIDFVYPLLSLKKDSTYNLELDIKKAKDFKLDIGGIVSSRAINTGFIGITYRNIGSTASSTAASFNFGKFYSAAKVNYTIDFPSVYPVKANPYFVVNRWDYFKSFATFFVKSAPSFLIQNELYYGLKIIHPLGNTIKSTFDFRGFVLEDDYYQTSDFTNADTSDVTDFRGGTFSWEFLQNTLNRKQFATKGHYFKLKARFVAGYEKTVLGSTSPVDTTYNNFHQWFSITADFQTFPISTKLFHLGFYGKASFLSQSLFSNYTASMNFLPVFSPIPDAETYFFKEYRSPQFVGIGTNLIFSIRKKLDLRADAFVYLPFVSLAQHTDGTAYYDTYLKQSTIIASGSVIYHSLIGPIRITLNYFPATTTKFTLLFTYGYVLFNERAVR